jgi:hypothetical protein
MRKGLCYLHVPGTTISANDHRELTRKYNQLLEEKYNDNIINIIQGNGGRRRAGSGASRRSPRAVSTAGQLDLDFTVRKQIARGRNHRPGW